MEQNIQYGQRSVLRVSSRKSLYVDVQAQGCLIDTPNQLVPSDLVI